MPFSNRDSIPTVLQFADLCSPRRVLDVGVGLGVYGMLLRTHLDIAHERLKREHWQLRIEGLEIFPDYYNPIWDYAYDAVHIGDAMTYEFPANSFDLVLISDVVEHLSQSDAVRLLERLLVVAPTVIVTTPVGHIEQGAWGGNPHETHQSVLTPKDFPHLVCTKYTGLTVCCVCCRDPELAEHIRRNVGSVPVSRPEWIPYISYRIRRKLRSLQRKYLGHVTEVRS